MVTRATQFFLTRYAQQLPVPGISTKITALYGWFLCSMQK